MLGTGCLRSAREALSLRCPNHWCTWKASFGCSLLSRRAVSPHISSHAVFPARLMQVLMLDYLI